MTEFIQYNPRPVEHAVISGTGNLDVVAAATGKQILILSLFLSADAAGAVTFKSASTSLGAVTFKTADPTFVLQDSDNGHFITALGEKFTVAAGSLNVTGALTYVKI